MERLLVLRVGECSNEKRRRREDRRRGIGTSSTSDVCIQAGGCKVYDHARVGKYMLVKQW